MVIPARDLETMYGYSTDQLEEMLHDQFPAYRATLQEDSRELLERYEIVDMARKVVGVGSVGTRAFIVLLQGAINATRCSSSQGGDRLGARRPPPKAATGSPGERVVQGQRLTQAASDIDPDGRRPSRTIATSTGVSCAT